MFCFVFTAGLDKASPSTIPTAWFAHQPRGCVFMERVVSMHSSFAAPSPEDQQQLPINRVLEKTELISAEAPNPGEHSWLAQRISLSILPSQLEAPIDFSEQGCWWGNVGVGEGSFSSTKPGNIKARCQRSGGDRGGHLARREPRSPGGFARSLSSPERQLWPLARCVNLSANTKRSWNTLFISRHPERRRALQERG